MRLRELLLEKRTKDISLEQLISIGRRNAKKNLEQVIQTGPTCSRVIMGSQKTSFGIVDPLAEKNTRERTPPYNIMMDTFKEWNGYPSRGQCVIFSAGVDYENNRFRGVPGGSFAIIPFDHGTVALSEEPDIWIQDLNTSLGSIELKNLNDIVYNADAMMNGWGRGIYDAFNSPGTPESKRNILLKFFSQIDDEFANTKEFQVVSETQPFINELKNRLKKNPEYRSEEFFREIFNPNTLRIKKVSTQDILKIGKPKREAWTETPCLVIHEDKWPEFRDKYLEIYGG